MDSKALCVRLAARNLNTFNVIKQRCCRWTSERERIVVKFLRTYYISSSFSFRKAFGLLWPNIYVACIQWHRQETCWNKLRYIQWYEKFIDRITPFLYFAAPLWGSLYRRTVAAAYYTNYTSSIDPYSYHRYNIYLKSNNQQHNPVRSEAYHYSRCKTRVGWWYTTWKIVSRDFRSTGAYITVEKCGMFWKHFCAFRCFEFAWKMANKKKTLTYFPMLTQFSLHGFKISTSKR